MLISWFSLVQTDPSPCQGCFALFIGMKQERQRQEGKSTFLLLSHRFTTLHLKGIASLSPLCRAQVYAVSHYVLPPWTTSIWQATDHENSRLKIPWRTCSGCIGLLGSHVMNKHQHSPSWPKHCWQTSKRRGCTVRAERPSGYNAQHRYVWPHRFKFMDLKFRAGLHQLFINTLACLCVKSFWRS